MNCENAIMSCEHLIMNRENAIVNQLPSEIFLLQSVSFLIKLSCKKLPPSAVPGFFTPMYPRQVKMSNVHLNFFCFIFRWGEKLDIKIWLYCFQFPRVQILLFVGWKSTRVKKRRKVKASEKFCSQFVVWRVEQQVFRINYRCLSRVLIGRKCLHGGSFLFSKIISDNN